MKLFKSISIPLFILLSTFGWAQSYPPPTTLVTVPSAGTLVRGSYSMEMRVQKGGGPLSAWELRIAFNLGFPLDRLI